jgi:hypothetical protein
MPEPGIEIADMRAAVKQGAIEWRAHVLKRMVERGIARSEVRDVLLSGERIEDYPTDAPFPSALFLGWAGGRPLHVVAAYSAGRRTAHIITVYEPDASHFEPDFKTRRKRR